MVVFASYLGADPLFAHQLHMDVQGVVVPTDFVAIEVVDVIEDSLVVYARIAEQLSNVGPVLLLDVTAVIFLVRPASCEDRFIRVVLRALVAGPDRIDVRTFFGSAHRSPFGAT